MGNQVMTYEELLIENEKLKNQLSEKDANESTLKETINSLVESQRLVHVGYWEYDLSTHKITWSNEVYDIFGLDKDSYTPSLTGLADLIHPDDLWVIAPETIEKNTKAGIQEMEYRIIDQTTKEIKYVVGKGITLRDSEGMDIKNFGTFQDITKRKLAELELLKTKEKAEENESYLKALLQSLDSIVVARNKQNEVVYYNEEFDKITQKLFGKKAYKGLVTLDFLEEDKKKYWLESMQKVLEGNLHHEEFSWQFTEQEERYYEITHYPVCKSNEIIGTLEITSDITEKRLAEEQIELQASLIEQVKNAVITIDFDNKIRSWNKHAEYLYQWKQEEVIGKNIIDLLGAEELKEETLKNFEHLNKDGHWEGNYNVKRKDGTTIPAHIINTYLKDHKGEKIGFMGISTDITDQLKAEREIKESLLTFAQAEKLAKIGSWKLDISSMNVSWSDGVFDIFRTEKFKEKKLWEKVIDRIHPDDKQYVMDVTEKAIEDSKPYELEYRIVFSDGTESTVLVNGNPVLDDGGKLVSYVGVVKDITDRIKSEADIKAARINVEENEKRLTLAAKAAQLGIWDWDIKQNILNWDNRTYELYGQERGEVENNFKLWADRVHPEDKERAIEELNDALEGIKEFDTIFRIIQPNGKVLHIKADGLVLRNKEGNPLRMIGVNLDITESKKRETELIKAKEKAEESEQRLMLATNSAELGIWDWNVNKNILVWDDRMFELYGLKKEALENTVELWSNGLHPEDKERAIKEVNDALNGIKDFDTTFKVLHPDGKELYIKGDALVLRDKKGNPQRMIGINRDITETKVKEIELKNAKEKAEESDRLKSEFINNMSHEIRTPMNGILGFSNMLNDDDITPEKRKHYTSIIKNSGNQLMRVIDDILEISRLGTKQVKVLEEEICLNDLLLEHFSVFDFKAKENKTPLYLNKELSDSASTILTDGAKLNKILSNLLENAIKYTHEGFIEFGYHLKDQFMELYVKDTGIGIKTSMHEKIFDRFSQEEKELSKNVGGLGLGLSIAKENTELLNGTITLESKKGKGSTFFVTLPYNQSKLKKMENHVDKPNGNKAQNQYTILIAEDEEINYLYIEVLLGKNSDYELKVLHAINGEKAVEICQGNTDISLVLMDLKMPIMNGYEAAEKIKAFRPELPIVAQTAYTRKEDKEKALTAGCNDFISKPITKEVLSEVLNKFLK